MNITIDTTAKTITINSFVSLKEFNEGIVKLIPDLEGWSLIAKMEQVGYYPFVFDNQTYPIYPVTVTPQWQTPTIPTEWGTICLSN